MLTAATSVAATRPAVRDQQHDAGVDGAALQQPYRYAPDPVLVGRDVLLDPAAVADRLCGLLSADGSVGVRAATLVRAKYRIGESLRVVYRLRLAGGAECTVTARAFVGGASRAVAERDAARPSHRAVRLGDGQLLRPVFHDSDLDAVWWTFPNDRRMHGLAQLLEPDVELAGLFAAGGTWVGSEVMEYAPERSLTLRASAADGTSVAYVKAYAPRTLDVQVLASRYDAVATALAAAESVVTAPVPLGWSAERGLLVLEAMPGERWADIERSGPAARAALGRLGAALATLHAIGDSDRALDDFGVFGRLRTERVGHSAELVAHARPDVEASAMRLRSALSAGPPAGDDVVLLHGDCHPKNALVSGNRIALIDLDQAGVGSPAADLGSLLARLHQDQLLARGTGHDDAAEYGALVLDGYSSVRVLPSEASLRWHTVAAMVAERAVRAVNRVNAPALEQLDTLLELAERIHREGVRR